MIDDDVSAVLGLGFFVALVVVAVSIVSGSSEPPPREVYGFSTGTGEWVVCGTFDQDMAVCEISHERPEGVIDPGC